MKRQKLGRVGCTRKQRIEGISPITYGWIDKSNMKKFYTTVGCHSKIEIPVGSNRFIDNLHNDINRRISSLTRDIFKNIHYPIVDVDIPYNITKTLRGFITVDVTVNSKVDIPVEEIELFNSKIVDVLLSTKSLTIFPTNKY